MKLIESKTKQYVYTQDSIWIHTKLTGVILSVLNESTVLLDLDNSFSASFSHCDTVAGFTYSLWAMDEENRVARMDEVGNAVVLHSDLVRGDSMVVRIDDILISWSQFWCVGR